LEFEYGCGTPRNVSKTQLAKGTCVLEGSKGGATPRLPDARVAASKDSAPDLEVEVGAVCPEVAALEMPDL